MKTNIEMICIEKLYPHPKNPRKELGDLTELSESIKESGIFQNLTVVTHPTIGYAYMVIIGHRRLEASKLAGITELPCAIVDMNEKEQLATMLLENMQRCDLTILEQAQGIQQMIDLGDTVEQIAQKTGLSKSTIYRRKNIMELDAEKTQAALNRGATIMDFMELEKIKEKDIKNQLLKTIGTSNFGWELRHAIRKEKVKENSPKVRKVLETFAKEEKKDYKIHQTYKIISIEDYADDFEIPNTEDGEEYFFCESPWAFDVFTLKKEQAETEEEKKKRIEWEEQERRKEELDKLCFQSYELRREFVLELSNNNIRKKMKSIQSYLGTILLKKDWSWNLNEKFAELSGINVDRIDSESELEKSKLIRDELEYNSDRNIMLITFCFLNIGTDKFHSWGAKYMENGRLEEAYQFMEMLGYECSDEELSLRNGTHELYWKE